MNGTWWVDQSELDDDQQEVISLGPDGSYLVIGPPGSGKTNLLLLRANYLCHSNKPDVLILVFTRTLREFIASGASRYAFSSDKVQTYNNWARRLLREHGVEPHSSDDFEEDRAILLSQLRNLVDREQLSELYDVILLDEAHDYLSEEIELLRRLGSNFFAVADSWQQIYRREQSVESARSLVDRTIPLRYHYRNGINICRLADQIMKGKGLYSPLEPTSNYDESARPSRIQHFRCLDIVEQCERIIAEIDTQRQAYPDELIGIICPCHEELTQVKDIIQQSPLAPFCVFQDFQSGYVPFDTASSICLSTLHSAKGLEFRALHFTACDTLHSFSTNRKMAFTGVTRAKTSLSLYYSDDLHGYLEKALVALFPRSDKPDISEAFGPGE